MGIVGIDAMDDEGGTGIPGITAAGAACLDSCASSSVTRFCSVPSSRRSFHADRTETTYSNNAPRRNAEKTSSPTDILGICQINTTTCTEVIRFWIMMNADTPPTRRNRISITYSTASPLDMVSILSKMSEISHLFCNEMVKNSIYQRGLWIYASSFQMRKKERFLAKRQIDAIPE